MRVSRAWAGVAMISAIAGTTLATSTTATAQTGSNSGGQSTIAPRATVPQGTVDPNASTTAFNRPNDLYVGHTCKFDLSAIPDGTQITTLEGCGITATFSTPMEKVSINGGTWGTWGSPPDTESSTPDILWTQGATSVTVTFSSPVRIAGAEAEPDPFEVHTITADYQRPAGSSKVVLSRDIDGSGGARLLADKTKNIGSVTFSSDVDFAIAQLRVNLDPTH